MALPGTPGQRISDLCNGNHISQKQLAKKIGVPLPKPPSVLLIPVRKNLSAFLPGKTSVSIRRNPHFTHQS